METEILQPSTWHKGKGRVGGKGRGVSGRNEMAMLGTALNNMSAELAESYAVLEQRVQVPAHATVIILSLPSESATVTITAGRGYSIFPGFQVCFPINTPLTSLFSQHQE